MTRLFIRFYVGVIMILMIALCIMTFACKHRMDTDFDGITERATAGGLRMARQTINTSTNGAPSTLEELQYKFNYPIRVIADDQIPATVREWRSRGADILVHIDGELSVLAPLNREGSSLYFGPISAGDGAIETDMLIAIGAVLLLVAIAIATLLRPLARQLSVIELTAVAFANGNLDARVDVQRADSARTLAWAFNDMAARTEGLLRTQRELLQAVSHELRTPLTRMTFAIDLIRTARTDDERTSRLNSLDTAAQDLDELVGELLQYVRLETGIPRTAIETIALRPLVEELIENTSLTCQAIDIQLGPGLNRNDVLIAADRSGLVRVLSNLLSNASRFSRTCIKISATANADGTTIDVDDDGPGISDVDRERVFEPFVRLTESDSGVGLGLALVKRIVTNHRGTVVAMQSPLGGCRMRTFWPATLH